MRSIHATRPPGVPEGLGLSYAPPVATGGTVGVGLIGCGNVSSNYLTTLARFPYLQVLAVSDLDMERARAQAARHETEAVPVAEMLEDPRVEMVVNLTVPAAHGPVGLDVLRAGKSLYNEKPIALQRDEAAALLAAGAETGLRVGSAPDTWMGDALQLARRVLDEGLIGEPVGVTAFSTREGPEQWHPNPGFFYEPGAGPLFDLGPYYVSVMVALLGPIRRVSAAARISFPERRIVEGPLAGTSIPVSTPTNVAAVFDLAAGPVGMLLTSFDVAASELPFMEIHGSHGTLSLPDPTNYGGSVRVRAAGQETWQELYSARVQGEERGTGAAEMALALRTGQPHRASGELGQHVLDVLASILESADEGHAIDLRTSAERPEPFESGSLGGAPVTRVDPAPTAARAGA
jgi:predicted dehydrogenase